MSICRANGIELDYDVLGSTHDPAVILIRGTGSQRVRWPADLLRGLVGQGLRVVTFDNRDTGGSTHFDTSPTPSSAEVIGTVMRGGTIVPCYTLQDMARDVVGLMDHLGLSGAHIVGLSMGGYIAQILAADHADRVRSLVALMSSPYPLSLAHVAPQVMEALMRGPEATTRAALVDFSVKVAQLSSGPDFPVNEVELRTALALELERARGTASAGETRQVMAMYGSGDLAAICARIRVPTLILHGTADPMIPYANARDLAQLIPDSVLVPLQGAGHEVSSPRLVPLLVQEIAAFCRRYSTNSITTPHASRG